MSNIVLGTDNGKSGSLVFLDINTGKIAYIEQYPNDAKKLFDLLQTFKPSYAVSEEVFMSPGFKGVASTDYQIMGRYAQCFEMLDIPYEFIRAVSWRPKVGIKGKGRDVLKQKAIEKVQELFSSEDCEKLKTTRRMRKDGHLVPVTYMDDNKCESALIAYYALLKWREIEHD